MTDSLALLPLAWDSNFLGFPVGRAVLSDAGQVAQVVATARQAGFRLLYLVLAPTDKATADAAARAGARLVDRKMTYVRQLPAASYHKPMAPAIGEATAYTRWLESLAWQSGEYSRFRLDPNFEPTVFQRMYSEWLRNSLRRTIARLVLVWHAANGQEQGLLTLGEKNDRADIGLLAVDQTARGHGIGQQLVAAASAQAAEWGHAQLQVVTQRDNLPACRFYEKCDFMVEQEEYIYHLWLT